MVDVSAMIAAVVAHKWVLLGALGIGAFVALSKQGWLGSLMQRQLPPRWIPFLAPAYAAMTVFSTEIMAGKTWQAALADSGSAIVSGFLAVLGHETVVEGIRNGREFIPAKGAKAPAKVSS